MPFNDDYPFFGSPVLKEQGYHKKNSPCGCGHDLSMPYGNCVACAEVDSSGNIIRRQIPFVVDFATDTIDAYYETSIFDNGFATSSYRNPLDYTNPSKGQTAPMFLKVRIEGMASNDNSFYSNADEINGEYTTVRLPFWSDTLSGRDDRACAWYGYPCSQDKIYSSAAFNKIELFFSSGVTTWFPTETFPPDKALYGTKSGMMDLYLNCRLSFAKYGHSYPGTTSSNTRINWCREGIYLGAAKSNSILEKKVKVGTIVRWQKLLSDNYMNSDVLCHTWDELELTTYNVPAVPYPTGAIYTIDGAWTDGYAMDEHMFDSSGLRIFVTSLPDGDENQFNKFIHNSNNGAANDSFTGGFGSASTYPYYKYPYDCGFSDPCTGYVYADTNTEVLEHGVGFGTPQEPNLRGEKLRDVYKTNPMPFAYKVTISELTNKNCNQCTGLNGEHILYLYGEDYFTRHQGDGGFGISDIDLYGKHFYNKEVPLPSSMGYSGTLPCIYGVKCSGVIAENFGLGFTPAVSGGFIDFRILNSKYSTAVNYRKQLRDVPLHDSLSTYDGFTQSYQPLFGGGSSPSSVVDGMCNWNAAKIKVESYFDSSEYTTNCFQPCLECYSCKDGVMPSSITVTIGDFPYIHNSTLKNAAGTYTLQKAYGSNITHGAYSTSYNDASNAVDVARGLWIYFNFGCMGGNNQLEIDTGGEGIGLPCGGNENSGKFYYNLPASSIGRYYSPLYYSGGFFSSDSYYPNVDFYDCSNVDGDAVFSHRTQSSCTQSGPTVHITFNA